MIRKLLFAVLFVVGNLGVTMSQSVLITDPNFDQSNPLNCTNFSSGSVQNFFDSGNTGGDYANNEDETIVLCPDLALGSKVTIAFGINTGFTFDVHGSDSIYVYDGPNITSPLLGVHNSVTDPNGFNHQASFVNNSSGCLTVRFVSDADSVGTGWGANITCGNPAQPFEVHMEGFVNGVGPNAMAPIDTGYIEICPTDSILYVANGIFPYSLENVATGYSQTNANVTYDWEFSDGTTQTGDSVWFSPPFISGFLVTLKITDGFPQTQQLVSKIRVAIPPNFSESGPIDDTICLGSSTILVGGVTSSDTVGITIDSTAFQLGGSFAGLTYLPDGSGINYQTNINISGFSVGQTITAASDIEKMCVTMEHSFLGDLEMLLTCPNGDTVNIFNSFGGGIGMLPGGFNGGGTYLGDAFDNNIANPGIGWEYCFSETQATFGTMATEFGLGNTVPATTFSIGNSMNPNGVYLPETSYSNMIGCPINGTWTLTIRDNLGIDDGYIFGWGIFFDPIINPNSESYVTTVDTAWWDSDPTVIATINDTGIVVQPNDTGFFDYTIHVTDNYGCTYDSTFLVYVLPAPVLAPFDSLACDFATAFEVNSATSASWTVISGPGTATFSPTSTDTIVGVNVDLAGIYGIRVVSQVGTCLYDDTLDVNFLPALSLQLPEDSVFCDGEQIFLDGGTYDLPVTYLWGPTSDTSRILQITEADTYSLTLTSLCDTVQDSMVVEFFGMPGINTNDFACDLQASLSVATSIKGGSWEFAAIEPNDIVATLEGTPLLINTVADDYGVVRYYYYDSLCVQYDSADIKFVPNIELSLTDTLLCQKDLPFLLTPKINTEDVDYTWSTGQISNEILVQTTGRYTLTAANECDSVERFAVLEVEDCSIFVPNVITPNGDGFNEVFLIGNIEYFDKVSIAIFNRWGNKLFEQENYDNSWDGVGPSGKVLPDGTYFYTVELDGGKVIRGTISIFSN